MMHAHFGYCFETPPGSEYPPIVHEHRIVAGEPMTVDGAGRRDHRPADAAASMATSTRSASASAGLAIPATSTACRKTASRRFSGP